MKKLLCFLLVCLTPFSYGQHQKTRVYVFVPGAWDGGWNYRQVGFLLSAQGHIVYRATLTGLGERVHLANKAVTLTTHIQDVVNLLKFKNLSNVVLIGHSLEISWPLTSQFRSKLTTHSELA